MVPLESVRMTWTLRVAYPQMSGAEHDGVRRVSAERGRVRRRRQQFDVPAAAVELLLVLGAELKHERLAFVRDRLAHVRAEGVEARVRGGLNASVRVRVAVPLPARQLEVAVLAFGGLPRGLRPSVAPAVCGWTARRGAGGRRRREEEEETVRTGSRARGEAIAADAMDGERTSRDLPIDLSIERSIAFRSDVPRSKKLERRRRERRARDAPSNRSSKYTSAETTEAIAARNARTVASLNMSRSAGEGSGRRARRSDGADETRTATGPLISETGGTRRTSISSTKKARAPPARRHKTLARHGSRRLRVQAREGVREGLHPSHPQVHEAGQEGVQQGGASNGDGVHRDGVRRVLREAHLVRRRPRAISVLLFLFLSLFIVVVVVVVPRASRRVFVPPRAPRSPRARRKGGRGGPTDRSTDRAPAARRLVRHD